MVCAKEVLTLPNVNIDFRAYAETGECTNIQDDNDDDDKKLSCRRETARSFVSLNILLTHSRSLKVIRNANDTVEYRACVSPS